MKRIFFAAIGMVAMVGLTIGATAQAGNSVAATVTIGTVSVNVDHATFDYGTMPFSSAKESFDILTSAKNIAATVGTVATDLTIKGSATAAWTINATTPATNVYEHSFGVATDGATRPASYAGLVLTDVSLSSNVAASGVIYFGLKMFTPTAGISTQQTATVTVTATWHG